MAQWHDLQNLSIGNIAAHDVAMERNDEQFAAWLAAARRRLRVSHDDVARHAGVSGETVRRAEAGAHIRDTTRDAIEDAITIIESLMTAADQNTLVQRLDALTARVTSLEEVGSLGRTGPSPDPSPADDHSDASPPSLEDLQGRCIELTEAVSTLAEDVRRALVVVRLEASASQRPRRRAASFVGEVSP